MITPRTLKLTLLSALLVTTAALNANCCCEHNNNQQNGVSNVINKYTASWFAGAIIGSTIGTTCAVFDAKTDLNLFFLTWYASYEMRHSAERSVRESFDEERVRYCKGTLQNVSWVSSWASWFIMMGLMNR